MEQKPTLVRPQIAKMRGVDAMHFLNSRAGYLTKSLGARYEL